MDKDRFLHYGFLGCCGIFFILMIASCSSTGNLLESTSSTSTSAVMTATSTSNISAVNQASTIKFTLSGGKTASYTLHAATPISMLRHGHREFTIDITQGQLSIFLVFFGYAGPRTYTLSKTTNGGDVHFSLGDTAPSWDLSIQPDASCAMTIASDTPTAQAGLDRMKGSFSCPHLFSSNPSDPQPSVTVRNGSFDIGILLES
jgi:hypothetical protein